MMQGMLGVHVSPLFRDHGAFPGIRRPALPSSFSFSLREKLGHPQFCASLTGCPSFCGDVNSDGWLDVAVGCDNIKDAMGGFPRSRLCVLKPNGPTFAPL
jgi:hypothetical protein